MRGLADWTRCLTGEMIREGGGLDNRNMTLSDLLTMIIPRKVSSVRDGLHSNIELTML